MEIRVATVEDAGTLAGLLADYLRERFPGHPGATADELRRDVLTATHGQRVLLGESDGRAVAFVAWDDVYDLHWAAKGILIADLYVVPDRRGHGLALALVSAACAEGAAGGARFLRGGSYDRQSPTGRFYERFAVGFDSAECHCGGRAFRHLAGLRGRSPREVLRSLPPLEWNHEA